MKTTSIFCQTTVLTLVVLLALGTSFILPRSAQAKPPVRGSAHVSVNHGGGHGGGPGGGPNTNINVNVNNPGGGHGHHDDHHHDDHHHDNHHHDSHHHDSHHHDGGSIIAGAITGLVVGSIVAAASMPPSCTTVVINNVSYRQCGSTWYQPCYSGTTLQYIVIDPPR